MTVKYPTTVLLAVLLTAASACSLLRHGKSPAATNDSQSAANQQGSTDQEAQPSPEPTPAPGAKIQILYTHSGDYLTSLTVTKYSSATILKGGSNGKVSVVRFDGGEPVWKIEVNRGFSSLLSPVPGIDENRKFALTEVTYGELPKNFTKDLPEVGAPEPLQSNFYYVFSVSRKIGPPSYQAVYVTPDGSIEGYDAQPLIGTSYQLCCSLAPDFGSSAPADNSSDTGGGP